MASRMLIQTPRSIFKTNAMKNAVINPLPVVQYSALNKPYPDLKPPGTANMTSQPIKDYDEIPMSTSKNRLLAGIQLMLRMKDGYNVVADQFHKKLGPIYRTGVLKDTVYISDIDSVGMILRKEGKYPQRFTLPIMAESAKESGLGGLALKDGPEWYKTRTSMNKVVMNTHKISALAPLVNDVTSEFITYLGALRNSQNMVILNEEIAKWALEISGRVLYDRRLECFSLDPPAETTEYIKCIHNMFSAYGVLSGTNLEQAKKYYKKTYGMLHEASLKASSITHTWLDTYLNDLKGQQNKESNVDLVSQILDRQDKAKDEDKLPEADLYGAVAELTGGSIETTTSAILFLMYEVSRRPDIQEQLYEEIKAVAPNGEMPSVQMLQNTPLLRGCVKETLRLYPIANAISRKLDEDIIVMHYRIPAGFVDYESPLLAPFRGGGIEYPNDSMAMLVGLNASDTVTQIRQVSDERSDKTYFLMHLYTLGRDPTCYENPTEFMPERWIRKPGDKKKTTNSAFSFLPFGFGARMCIGRRLVELEMHVLLFQMIQKYRMEWAVDKPLKMGFRLITIPASEVKIKLKNRTDRN